MAERLAVLGATGYTGQLLCAEARDLGFPLRLVGRRRDALDALAADGDEVAVADARDEVALTRAFEGAFAVVSCAGPFLELGTAPISAALASGAHYLDTSGEQRFAQLVYERFGSDAGRPEPAVLTSFGFDYAPGDFAARLAANGLEPLDELIVAYGVSRLASSRGTRRTLGHVLGQPQLAYSAGALVPSRFGATTRRVRFPTGEASVVEWGGTEPLTVPRHTRVREVRSYLRAPRAAAVGGRLAGVMAPVIRVLGGLGPAGPSEQRRKRARFAIVAEARGSQGRRRVTLTGEDVYGVTALLLARGAEALRAGEARGAGALAPAEAFDARTFLEKLSPLLAIHAVEDL